MNELLATLTNLSYELFGVILPGIVVSIFILLYWIALGPVAPIWTFGIIPAFTMTNLQVLFDSLSLASGIGVAIPLLAIWYFLGHILLWIARSGKADAAASKGSVRRVVLSLVLQIPKPNNFFHLNLEPLYNAVRKRFTADGAELDSATVLPGSEELPISAVDLLACSDIPKQVHRRPPRCRTGWCSSAPIASWPAWPEFSAELRRRALPLTSRGVSRCRLTPTPATGSPSPTPSRSSPPTIPVCAGIAPSFTLTERDVLLPGARGPCRAVAAHHVRHPRPVSRFFSADLAIRGRRDPERGLDAPPRAAISSGWSARGASPSCTCNPATARDLRRPDVPPAGRQRHPVGGLSPAARASATSRSDPNEEGS